MGALSKAVFAKDLDAVRKLLAKGREAVPYHEVDGALQTAVQLTPPSLELVEALAAATETLAPGAGSHALGYAAARGRLEFVRTLLRHGTPASRPGDAQAAPLYHAAAAGHADVVAALLDAGADPNHFARPHATDKDAPDGYSAVFGAVRGKHAAVVRLLAERGADLNRVGAKQRTALDLAREIGDADTIATLERAGAKPVSDDMLDLSGAIQANAVNRVRAVTPGETPEALRKGFELACRWENREHCVAALLDAAPPGALRPEDLAEGLSAAGRAGRVPTLDLLLSRGADPNAFDPAGEHPLYHAARSGSVEAVNRLLAAGADANRLTREKKSALHGAAKSFWAAGVVEPLLRAGADPTLVDYKNRTALAVAREEGNGAVAQALAKYGPKPRTPAQVLASAKKKVKPYVRKAFFPEVGEAEQTPDGSRFGGLPGLRAAENWPACGKCEGALTLMFQLNTRDAPRPLKTPPRGARVIQWFYCTTCQPDKSPSNASVLRSMPASELAILGSTPRGQKSFPARVVTGWTAKSDYPYRDAGPEAFRAARAELDREECESLRKLNLGGWKSGGWPHWIQDAEYPEKVREGRVPWHLVLQLDMAKYIPFEYGDGGIGMVFCAEEDPTRLEFVWQTL